MADIHGNAKDIIVAMIQSHTGPVHLNDENANKIASAYRIIYKAISQPDPGETTTRIKKLG